MEGMTLDLDNNIGKFVSSLIHTLTSITSLEEDVEEISDEPEEEQDGLNQSSISSSDPNLLNPVSFTVQHRFSAPPVAEVEDDAQQFRHRVHSLEKKMHEHAMLVADLANCGGVSELTLETERRKLRQLEQLHLREFRRLVVTKLKGHVSNTKQHDSQRKSANEEPQQRKATPRSHLLMRSLEGSSLAGGSSGGGTPRAQLQTQQGSTVVKELLDMNIDVKVYIECGKCILRADPSKQLQQLDKTSFLPGHRRQFSAGTTSMTVDSTTQLSLPSVDARFIYTSDDAKMPLPQQMEENFGFVKSYRSLNQKCFYTSLELASMPLTTLITPALIDFLDQTLDPLTSTIFDKSSIQKASSEIGSFDEKKLDPAVELIAIDRLGLSFDLILHVSVQASSLRFEGRQQKSSAADCLLTLPSLTLNGCTRKCCDGMDRPTIPHQQASAHDALSLTLDRLRVTASRTRNSSLNSDDPTASNDVRLVFKFEAGKAAIVHDMRRLDELISFPKAWYRKKLIKRLFLGQKSLKAPNTVATRKELSMSTEQSVGYRNLNSEKSDLNHSSAGVGTNWKALVDVTFDWEEMNVNAQMSTTMGFTTWLTKRGSTSVAVMFDSSRNRELGLRFELGSSQIVADGGVISGEMSINSLAISTKYSKFIEKAPEHNIELQVGLLQSKIEWMGRSIFIVRIIDQKMVASTDWSYKKSEDEEKVKEAHCFLKMDASWSDLDLIITRTTSGDFVKIGQKLRLFFKDQLHNSRVIWEEQFGGVDLDDDGSSIAGGGGSNSSSVGSNLGTLWHDVLDQLSEIQLHHKFLPLPDADDGITLVGGDLNFWARRISLACMDGDTTNAAVWALFHMVEPGIGISSRANYEFVSSKVADTSAAKQIGIALQQKFKFRLGNVQQRTHDGRDESRSEKCKAIICRVQYSRGSMLRHNSPIEHCVSALIGDVLAQLRDVVGGTVPSNASDVNEATSSSVSSAVVSPAKLSHNVLQLFQFAALNALLTNLQHQPIFEDGSSEDADNPKAKSDREDILQTVFSKFVCQFHDAVRIQTEFNAQLGFLPDLLRSYLHLQTDGLHKQQQQKDTFSRFPLPLSSSSAALTKSPKDQITLGRDDGAEMLKSAGDQRIYVCEEWDVDPKIQFIDRFKWNPPVIDDILKRLQIFDHRRTIPKVMQRSVFDRCDHLLFIAFSQILAQLRKEKR
uniref:Bridge-like lipid transfer protein family member 1 C-terminal domain-containing protein n=1 Tax=Globodera rostochiensis TaxID=31243 RepID=A0A914HX46_GLORO